VPLPQRYKAKTCHLLVGNGFSIACDPIFRYGSLYDTAVQAGLSERAQAVFVRLGANNFEGVLTLLENAAWTTELYGAAAATAAQMRADADIVKNALIQAVTHAHLAHTGMVSEAKYAAARQFLSPYHNIFTTNYDLLLYWTILQQGAATHQDGFRSDDDDPFTQVCDRPHYAVRIESGSGERRAESAGLPHVTCSDAVHR
jgi:hypothetical protein